MKFEFSETLISHLLDSLKKHEGLRLKPYQDTMGRITIGYGRNLQDRGISQKEAEYFLSNDVNEVFLNCFKNFVWFPFLNDPRKAVIIEMVYNMGMKDFKSFKKTIFYIENKDWEKASEEMLRSRWADQVGNRARSLSNQMRTGNYT